MLFIVRHKRYHKAACQIQASAGQVHEQKQHTSCVGTRSSTTARLQLAKALNALQEVTVECSMLD